MFDKEKELREKIRAILEKVRDLNKKISPQEKTKFFEERIDTMLNEGKITKKEADEIKAHHRDLIKLEEDIWADGVMTKDEQKKLFETRRKFQEKLKNIFNKEFKRKKKAYKEPTPPFKPETPLPPCKPERGEFWPTPPFVPDTPPLCGPERDEFLPPPPFRPDTPPLWEPERGS